MGSLQKTFRIVVKILKIEKYSLSRHHIRMATPKNSFDNTEDHFDEYEHYNFDDEKSFLSGHSGKQRTKKEASMNTNRHNPGGHERKITTKLMNTEKNKK